MAAIASPLSKAFAATSLPPAVFTPPPPTHQFLSPCIVYLLSNPANAQPSTFMCMHPYTQNVSRHVYTNYTCICDIMYVKYIRPKSIHAHKNAGSQMRTCKHTYIHTCHTYMHTYIHTK